MAIFYVFVFFFCSINIEIIDILCIRPPLYMYFSVFYEYYIPYFQPKII